MHARPLLVSVAILAVACGCAATPGPAPGVADAAASAAARTEIRLQVGQSSAVEGAAFRITFDGVGGDSRCPKGAQCVWEGSAAVRISVTGATGTQAFELQTSARAGPDAAAYEDWAIRVTALEPYPVEGREIAPTAYVVTLAVERGAAGLAAQ